MFNMLSTRLSRRALLGSSLGASFGHASPQPRTTLTFPRDAGSHPDYAIEWWYVTGYAVDAQGEAAWGFQVTFFRSRVAKTQAMLSTLAARHVVFAHAALTDVRGKKLWHDQRMARSSGMDPGLNPNDSAWASTRDTNIRLRDWSLTRQGADLQASIPAQDFSINIKLVARQPVLLQGKEGLSQKGPEATQTSFYYSLPQLQVQGELGLLGKSFAVGSGSTAWLDHEWSQQIMPPQAVGWDWMGINLLDGSALTAFRLRDKAGAAVWDGGSFRANGRLVAFQRGDVVFTVLRSWNSPASQARYPVEWLVQTPLSTYTVRALLDDQELDSRVTTGAIYWEGLCGVWDNKQNLVGRGYLEMTGYASAIRL